MRELAVRLNREVAIMADLQGPKIRIGKFADGKVGLEPGQRFVLDADCELGDARVGLDYKELPDDVAPGAVLLLDDGLIELIVEVGIVGRGSSPASCRAARCRTTRASTGRAAGCSAPALSAKDIDDARPRSRSRPTHLAVSVSQEQARTCTWRAHCCAPPAAGRC